MFAVPDPEKVPEVPPLNSTFNPDEEWVKVPSIFNDLYTFISASEDNVFKISTS